MTLINICKLLILNHETMKQCVLIRVKIISIEVSFDINAFEVFTNRL